MNDASPPPADDRSAYERLGGEAALRAIIDDFVDRVTSDMMIGFHFRAVDKQKLKDLEFQFASRHLGGPHKYEGRALTESHRAHPIMGGQFNRRLRLLDQTLQDHGAPPDVRLLWLAHNEKLRSQITRDAPNECIAPRPVDDSHTDFKSARRPDTND